MLSPRDVELDVLAHPVGRARVARDDLRVQRGVVVVVEREVRAEGRVVHRAHLREVARETGNRCARAREIGRPARAPHEPDPIDRGAVELRLHVELREEIGRIAPAAAEDVPASRLPRVHRPLAHVARHVVHAARAHAARCRRRAPGPVASYRPCGTTQRAASGMAAAFHSSTVGSSFRTKRAYARASYQLTPPTGRSSASGGGAPPSHDDGPG